MADTKVSGLAAAASLLSTHELPVNEAGTSKKVTGAQIIAAVGQGTGQLGSTAYAQVVANQTGITTTTDLTSLAVTVTTVAGRRYRISSQARLNQNTSTQQIVFAIQEGATVINIFTVQAIVGTALGWVTAVITPSAASHTYKMTLATGGGTVDLLAAATNPAYILIEDIGV